MKRVLIYTENYVPGGGNRYLIDIAKSIDEAYELYIISNKEGLFNYDLNRIKRPYHYRHLNILTSPRLLEIIDKQKIFRFLLFQTFRYFQVFIIYFFKIYNTYLFSKAIRNLNLNLIISCNGGFPGGLSCLDMVYAAKKNHIPVILSVVSMPQKTGKAFKIIYKKVKNYCDQIMVNTAVIKETFIRNYQFEEGKLIIVHNCIDFQDIKKIEGHFRKYLEENFDIRGNKLIGYVGRIEDLKGIYILLDAFAEVLKSIKNVKLVLVGSGEIKKAQLFADSLKINKNVIFIGYYEGNIYEVIDTFDVFAFPSLWEGLPYVILEAMALGKIIVASNVGGIPELIVEEKTGFLVNPKNSFELANKIINSLNNTDKHLEIRYNAIKAIEENFSDFKFALRINNVLNEYFK